MPFLNTFIEDINLFYRLFIMEKHELEKWFIDFLSSHFENGNIELNSLRSVLLNFSVEDRQYIIDELLKRNFIYFACGLIPIFGSHFQKKVMRERLRVWLSSEEIDSDGQYYFYALMESYEDSDFELVREVFSDRRSLHFNVPLKLFQIDPEYFCKTLEKQLASLEDHQIYESEALSYLIQRPDVIDYLIDNLDIEQSSKMKKFCYEKSKRSYYKTEVRAILVELSNK